MDSYGTPILAFPHFNLFKKSDTEDIWETTWHDIMYNGDYEITFYAEDNEGNIASSDSPVISVTDGVEPPLQAGIQIVLEKDQYQLGEHLKAELIEDLGWGYDLYVAIVMPDGNNFVAFKDTNQFNPINDATKWRGQRAQHTPLTLVDFTLPPDLLTGKYCFWSILSPERESVLKVSDLWVSTQQCVEILP